MLVLRSNPASPFVRKVRIVAALLNLDDRIETSNADTSDPVDSLRTQNPLGKIPALILEDGEVLYDSAFDVYLAVYQAGLEIQVRASNDLLHWSEPIGTPYTEAGHTLYYPTLMGETGDPTIGGQTPRLYVTSFPTGSFPNYTTSVFESVPLTLSQSQ